MSRMRDKEYKTMQNYLDEIYEMMEEIALYHREEDTKPILDKIDELQNAIDDLFQEIRA